VRLNDRVHHRAVIVAGLAVQRVPVFQIFEISGPAAVLKAVDGLELFQIELQGTRQRVIDGGAAGPDRIPADRRNDF